MNTVEKNFDLFNKIVLILSMLSSVIYAGSSEEERISPETQYEDSGRPIFRDFGIDI